MVTLSQETCLRTFFPSDSESRFHRKLNYMKTAYLLPQVDSGFSSQNMGPEPAASWGLVEIQTRGPIPDLLNQNLHFKMTPLQVMQVTVWEALDQISDSHTSVCLIQIATYCSQSCQFRKFAFSTVFI